MRLNKPALFRESVNLADVRLYTRASPIQLARAWLQFRAHRLRRTLYAISLEVRSCFRNSVLLYTKGLHGLPLQWNWECFPGGSRLNEKQRLACIEDIQKVKARYPWASRVELEMIARGWVLGERHFLDN